ncbi:MAG: ATP-binding protein [Flavobacteriales bacterium]
MFQREIAIHISESMREFPAIGIIGSRQVGKTTLAKSLAPSLQKEALYLDLERPSDLIKLSNAEYFLAQNRDKCLILDEVQRTPEIFPILRSEIDEHREPGRFILLGSASPALMRASSESLAGRIDYFELPPLLYSEVIEEVSMEEHWLFGGYPEPLQKKGSARTRWHEAFLRSYIERDLPQLGLNTSSIDLRRLLTMLAYEQGYMENDSKLAVALGVKSPTVKRTIDFIEEAFLIHRVPAWFTNAKKRIVKSPKIYFSDSGLYHHLLGITDYDSLLSHPSAGFSFEGYVINQIIHDPKLAGFEFYHYRTQDGTECDLIAVKNGKVKYGFEVKLGSIQSLTKSTLNSMMDLQPEKLFLVTPNSSSSEIQPRIFMTNPAELRSLYSA